MSAQIFLDTELALDILFGELPDGVYAEDRADNSDPNLRSVSSSELRAIAQTIGNLYDNLQDIYFNKFISTIQPDGLAAWEKDVFSSVQDSSLPFQQRKDRLLAKLREIPGISVPSIEVLIHGILDPIGLTFELLPFSGQFNGTIYGAWILTLSQLGLDTYLGIEDPLLGTGLGPGQVPLDCSLNYAAAGLTAQDLLNIQETAYGYAVLIYGVADAMTLAQLDLILTEKEPARSTHFIINNATPPFDPSIIDFGFPAGDTLIDSIDFGTGAPAATYDVWDFNL